MLYDSTSAVDADFGVAEETAHDTKTTPRRRLSDEEQLYVWCLLLQNNLVGQTNIPGYRERKKYKPHYERLLPDSLILQEVNRKSDVEVSLDMLKAICKRFQGTRPPYDSFNLPPVRGSK
jgi:hypothetical protein